jgi:putative peptidoglycan lipid II flippase
MTIRKLLSAGALIAVGMVAGRVLGFLREILLAAYFGSGSEANIAIFLLLIPDFITALLIGGAVSAVLIPAFAERDSEHSLALFWQSLMLFVVVFIILSIGLSLCFGSGFIAVALCSLPLTAATGIFTAYLQHRGKFIVPAFTTVIFNSVILAALWFLPADLLTLAVAVIVASSARLGAGMLAFFQAGGRFINIFSAKLELNRKLLSAYAQTIASNMLGIFILYTPFGLAALLSLNDFALFNYAFKLIIFPTVLIQTIIQMVLLPWFVSNLEWRSRATQAAHLNDASPRDAGPRISSSSGSGMIYNYSIGGALVISLIASLIVTFLSGFIAEICFGYGKMTAQDVTVIGKLLAIGIWVTPFMVLLSVYQQIFYAHKKTRIVLVANIVLALAVAPLCFVGHITSGNEGMLAGFVIAQIAPVIILAVRKHKGLIDGV